MAVPGDSRFGQWANPNFGASLSQPQQAQGVLPSPGGDMSSTSDASGGNALPSASSDQSNGVVSQPFNDQVQLAPGLMKQRSRPGSIFLADGGEVPENSGDAQPAQADPFALVQQALAYGRQKLGLPDSLFDSVRKGFSNADKGLNNDIDTMTGNKQQSAPPSVNSAVTDEGGNGTDDDGRAMAMNNSIKNLQPGEQVGGGDTGWPAIPYQPQAENLAEGGQIDEDTGTDQDDQGVIPDQPEQGQEQQAQPQQGQQQAQQPNPRAAMAYLMGAGAVSADQALALEKQVDPHGTMDPNLRKMKALQAAGTPDKAFGLMQHYRQKFNAYNAFAKAAAQGGQGKPADLHASARAATQAYQHVPDGNDIKFNPIQGGMHVAVRKVIPSQPAPSGGEDNSQTQGQTQSFADGGQVEDDQAQDAQQDAEDDVSEKGVLPDNMNVETANAAPADRGGLFDKPTGRAPHEMVRDFVLSIPQYLGWLGKGGQYDQSTANGTDQSLADAAQTPPQEKEGSLGPNTEADPSAGGASLQNRGGTNPQLDSAVSKDRDERTAIQGQQARAQDPKQVGAQIGAEANEEGWSLSDMIKNINRAYPMVSQSQQRELAILAARQSFAKGTVETEKYRIQGEAQADRARITGGFNVQKAQVTGDASVQKGENHEVNANGRVDKVVGGKAAEGQKNRAQKESQFVRSEGGKTKRTLIANPGTNTDQLKKDSGALQDQDQDDDQDNEQNQAPQQSAAPVTKAQPSGADIAYLKKNPGVRAMFDARFGAGASRRVLGQ